MLDNVLWIFILAALFGSMFGFSAYLRIGDLERQIQELRDTVSNLIRQRLAGATTTNAKTLETLESSRQHAPSTEQLTPPKVATDDSDETDAQHNEPQEYLQHIDTPHIQKLSEEIPLEEPGAEAGSPRDLELQAEESATNSNNAPSSTNSSIIASFEEFFAGKVLSRVGSIALILGSLFFIKHAVENNWISEWMRVGIGLVVSGVLMAVAKAAKDKGYDLLSQGALGAALPVMYLSIYAAYGFYDLLPQTATYVALLGASAISIWRALEHESEFVVLLAYFGAALTPFLAAGEVNNNLVFSVHELLVCLSYLAIVNLKQKWQFIASTSIGFTALLLWIMILNDDMALASWPVVAVVGIWAAVANASLCVKQHWASGYGSVIWTAVTVSSMMLFTTVASIPPDSATEYQVMVLCVGMCISTALALAWMLRRSPTSIHSSLLLMVLVPLVAMIPTASAPKILSEILFGLMIAIASFISARFQLRYYRMGLIGYGLFLMCLCLPLLFLGNSPQDLINRPTPFFSWDFASILVFYLAFFSLARFVKSKNGSDSKWQYAFMVLAIGFLVARLGIEVNSVILRSEQVISTIGPIERYWAMLAGSLTCILATWAHWFFSRKHSAFHLAAATTILILSILVLLGLSSSMLPHEVYSLVVNPRSVATVIVALMVFVSARLSSNLTGEARFIRVSLWSTLAVILFVMISVETVWPQVLVLTDRFSTIDNRTSAMNTFHLLLSISWIGYSAALLAAGFLQRLSALRVAGLALLAVAVLKVFLYDLSYLEQGRRIISFVVLGVILLLSSLVYQKYKNRLGTQNEK